MKRIFPTFVCLLILACTTSSPVIAHPPVSQINAEIAIPLLKEQLASESGAKLLVHGASHDAKMYVGTFIYDNILNGLHVSLLSRDPAVQAVLSTLKRHDSIRVWGRVLDFEAPQPHISITKIVIEKPYAFPGESYHPPVQWEELAKELANQDEAIVEVHAMQDGGKVLVVEFQRHIFPIFTRQFWPEASSLNRQDFVKIHFRIQQSPSRPTHLELVAGPAGKAIDMIDSISAQHGKVATLRGDLVFFPKGGVTSTNVFAAKVEAGHGLHRTYTLVNFKSKEAFEAIRDKIQKVWDESDPACRFNDRNKIADPCLEVEATGTINHVDPNQANPQILLNAPSDVTIRKATPRR